MRFGYCHWIVSPCKVRWLYQHEAPASGSIVDRPSRPIRMRGCFSIPLVRSSCKTENRKKPGVMLRPGTADSHKRINIRR